MTLTLVDVRGNILLFLPEAKLNMARRDKEHIGDLFDLLVKLPWWNSVCVSMGLFITMRFILPAVPCENAVFKGIASVMPTLSWLALFLLLIAPFSAIKAYQRRQLLDTQSGIESIRALPWKEFEKLLAEAYRRSGYMVRENESAGPDGGIDLILEKNGSRYLVQCKQWRTHKVGVKAIREMFGLMTAERAAGVFIVTSGIFTQEAGNFASGKPIDLVDGSQLAEMIRNVQPRPLLPETPPPPETPAKCPRCGNDLVLRTAKRGKPAGSQFWGCEGYPSCRYTRSHDV